MAHPESSKAKLQLNDQAKEPAAYLNVRDERIVERALKPSFSSMSEASVDYGVSQSGQTATRSKNPSTDTNNNNNVEAEWIEHYELGVYITLLALRDGIRDLKRVRFSRRGFGESQTEIWWAENREKVYLKYNVRDADKSSIPGQNPRRSEGTILPSSLHQ